jgi:Aminotransferase class-V
MTSVIPLLRGAGRRPVTMASSPDPLDVPAIRNHFSFPELGRIVTNNAASTQPPRELVALYQSLAPGYENVHRGQSAASQRMTALFEESYDTIAQFVGAPMRLTLTGASSSARAAVNGGSTAVAAAAIPTPRRMLRPPVPPMSNSVPPGLTARAVPVRAGRERQ